MSYGPIIKQAIQYIEVNLSEELSLEIIAFQAGFSKYHFHRVFQQEIGMTVMEYVRNRRIAGAASMLLNSEEKILDIAFYYRFESQESFTRAFKKVYQLPPGQYRKIMSVILFQKEEMKMSRDSKVKGWFLSGSHPFHYEMGVDHKVFHAGTASGYVKSVAAGSPNEFATMMQEVDAKNYIGKRMKLSGFLKAEDVSGFCGMWMRVDNVFQEVLQFDNMSDRPITGSTEWSHAFIVLDIPQGSAVVSFGVLLNGTGQVWMDEVRFEEVDKDLTPTTNINYKQEVNEAPINLSFEE
ncbi:MAG: helix-turn-helix transcriptional regulator [Bacillus sp. (in: firmicutes)]